MTTGRFSHRFLRPALALLACAAACQPALAGDTDKVPYWASLRGRQVNAHVGPGEDYRITYQYHREDLPMKVLRKLEGWRLVEDPDGARGWMLARFLKPERGAIVVASKAAGKAGAEELPEMRDSAGPSGRVLWRLEPGVTGKLGDCAEGWCRFDTGGRRGFVQQEALWGPGNP